jgi:hypothetical protein
MCTPDAQPRAGRRREEPAPAGDDLDWDILSRPAGGLKDGGSAEGAPENASAAHCAVAKSAMAFPLLSF